MRSIKPGRGPSYMQGIASLCVAGFGIIWTCMAATMGAPFFFPVFGLVFVALGIAQAVYSFKNATGKNRYSAFDITDGDEEPDPLNMYHGDTHNAPVTTSAAGNFCPYCGTRTGGGHVYCKNCGKRIGD